MRGKLRDKRSDAKRDVFKRDVIERRRTNNKRDNRSLIWLNQFEEDENQLLDAESDEEETLVTMSHQQKKPKK